VSKLRSKSSAQVFLSATAFILLTGFGSCSPHIDEACRREIPQFQKKLETAHLEIKTDYVRPEGRALASVNPGNPAFKGKLTDEEKAEWQAWAIERLKEVQNYMDIARGESKIGKVHRAIQNELASTANELVSFDGFTQKNQTKFMLRALESAQKHADTAVRLACSPQ
jgi:hypothetical protein